MTCSCAVTGLRTPHTPDVPPLHMERTETWREHPDLPGGGGAALGGDPRVGCPSTWGVRWAQHLVAQGGGTLLTGGRTGYDRLLDASS